MKHSRWFRFRNNKTMNKQYDENQGGSFSSRHFTANKLAGIKNKFRFMAHFSVDRISVNDRQFLNKKYNL